MKMDEGGFGVDIPSGIFDENGNLILPDTSWMDEEFTPPSEPQLVDIPSWVTDDPLLHDVGMWLHLGYSAASDGPSTNARRRSLIEIYTATFVQDGHTDIDYLGQFGEPMSNKRFFKIKRYLSGQITSKARDIRMKNAVHKWVGDRDWFLRYVGERHGIKDDKK